MYSLAVKFCLPKKLVTTKVKVVWGSAKKILTPWFTLLREVRTKAYFTQCVSGTEPYLALGVILVLLQVVVFSSSLPLAVELSKMDSPSIS